jgi:hypothetical protein
MIHFCAFVETDHRVVAGITGCCGGYMILRHTACDHAVMTAVALFGRAFKYTPNMASFAGNKLMLTGEGESGREVIKSQPLIWYRCRLRTEDYK